MFVHKESEVITYCGASTHTFLTPVFQEKGHHFYTMIRGRGGGGGSRLWRERLHLFTMTWKTLKTQWNGERTEDWWRRGQRLTCDGVNGSALTYCWCYLLSCIFCHVKLFHECIKVALKGKHGSWQESMPVQTQKKMTLPVHLGQNGWEEGGGGRVNLS